MRGPLENILDTNSDYDGMEDEAFPPLPPPLSPGQGGQDDGDPFGNEDGDGEGEVSKLADVPAAKRKGVKRPQPKLDSNRLISDRGLPALRTLFENVRFKGKGHEAEDLRLLMQKMENWAHRLYPKLQFDDFIDRVEKLGAKKEVQTCLKRIRLDMPLTHEDYMDKDGEEAAAPESNVFRDPDPFNAAIFPDDLPGPIHSTPAPSAPPAPSPSAPPAPSPSPPFLTEEQRKLIELNRQRALERKLARQQQQQQQQQTDVSDSQTVDSSTSADEPTSVPSANVPDTSKDQQEEQEDLNPESASSSTEQPSEPPHTDSEPPAEPPAEPPQCEEEEQTSISQDQTARNSCEDGE